MTVCSKVLAYLFQYSRKAVASSLPSPTTLRFDANWIFASVAMQALFILVINAINVSVLSDSILRTWRIIVLSTSLCCTRYGARSSVLRSLATLLPILSNTVARLHQYRHDVIARWHCFCRALQMREMRVSNDVCMTLCSDNYFLIRQNRFKKSSWAKG